MDGKDHEHTSFDMKNNQELKGRNFFSWKLVQDNRSESGPMATPKANETEKSNHIEPSRGNVIDRAEKWY